VKVEFRKSFEKDLRKLRDASLLQRIAAIEEVGCH
jgi:mRNA-degrading endonuclease RelE of RelBE toxin-antitoxin system